jgi:predicted phage tail protein
MTGNGPTGLFQTVDGAYLIVLLLITSENLGYMKDSI